MQNESVFAGQTVTFTVSAPGATAFQWFYGGVAIPGATSATYTIPAATSASAGLYTITVTGPGGQASSSATLTVLPAVNPRPVPTSAPGSAIGLNVITPPSVTAGAPFSFTVTTVPAGVVGDDRITITTDGKGETAPSTGLLVNGTATLTATFNQTGSILVTDGLNYGSAAVIVAPAADQAIGITAPAIVAAGVPFTVTAVANDVQGTLMFTIQDSDPAGVMPASGTFAPASASFTATLNTPGDQVITLTDGATTSSAVVDVVIPAQVLTVTAPAVATTIVPVTFTVMAGPAGTGTNDPLTIQIFDPLGMAPATATLANGTATFTVTFGSIGSQVIYVADALNNKALGYAILDVQGYSGTYPASSYYLGIAFPTFITLGSPFNLSLDTIPAGAGSGDLVQATLPPLPNDPRDLGSYPVLSATLASDGIATVTGEYPATAGAIAAVGNEGINIPGIIQVSGTHVIPSYFGEALVVVPPAAGLYLGVSAYFPIQYSPVNWLATVDLPSEAGFGNGTVLQGIPYEFTVVGENPGLRTFAPDAWVGPDPIAITSSDPAAVLPASGKLELDSVGAFNFGNTSAPYVYYKVTGGTTFYGSFNTPGPQTVTVVDQANPSATATIGLDVVAFAPPAITTAPLSQTVAIGAAASLWVAVSGGTPLAYQWNFNGSPIAGATNSVLTLPSVTTASAGSYTVTVTNAVGSVTSPAAVLTTSGSGRPPLIVLQPRPVLVNGHSSVVFTVLAGPPAASVDASGGNGAPQTRVDAATTYQWFCNDVPLPGATAASFGLGAVTAANDGNYTCLVSNGSGSVMTAPAALEVVADHASRLTNFSCRAEVGSGSAVAIIGFVVSGQPDMGTRNFLVRASGPALAQFGLTGLLPDPRLQLDNTYGPYDSNAGWGGRPLLTAVSSSLGAFAWPSGTSKDAALFETLPPGAYTAEISGASGDSGIALGEVYDANPAFNPRSAVMNLANISMRGQVGTGGDIMIAGFTITGPTAKTVLIRASGPALTPFGVTGVLPDPALRVLSGSTVLATDTGWAGDPLLMSAAASVGAFSWGASGTPDSAVLVTLPPGDYTAEVSGSSGDTGVALIEVYALP